MHYNSTRNLEDQTLPGFQGVEEPVPVLTSIPSSVVQRHTRPYP